MKRYPWETWQEEYLRTYEKDLSRVRIGKLIGKSAQAVRLKLMRMKGECFKRSDTDQTHSLCSS